MPFPNCVGAALERRVTRRLSEGGGRRVRAVGCRSDASGRAAGRAGRLGSLARASLPRRTYAGRFRPVRSYCLLRIGPLERRGVTAPGAPFSALLCWRPCCSSLCGSAPPCPSPCSPPSAGGRVSAGSCWRSPSHPSRRWWCSTSCRDTRDRAPRLQPPIPIGPAGGTHPHLFLGWKSGGNQVEHFRVV
jgi:hypothetical protein